MSKTVTFAIISDLHYRQHKEGEVCRPAAAAAGEYADPVEGLLKFIQMHRDQLSNNGVRIADYLLCPGDICDRANGEAFEQGWTKLKALQNQLGALHLIASTGNHEIDSRAEKIDNQIGNVEAEVDPLKVLQQLSDYPTALLENDDRRWVYWGRGYDIIEHEDLLLLLINSSHFHLTTLPNEYERGRIGDVALEALRAELQSRVSKDENRLFVVLLHHHPIAHENLDVNLGRIPMNNGTRLMQVLMECNVAWLVIHGHKHFPRLIRHDDMGPGQSIIFGAGSAGIELGDLAQHTRLQFYLVEATILNQDAEPSARGRVRAISWTGREWVPSMKVDHGMPDGCGYQLPEVGMSEAATQVHTILEGKPYMTWHEVVQDVPQLANLFPKQIVSLKRAFDKQGIECVWADDDYFPTELGRQQP